MGNETVAAETAMLQQVIDKRAARFRQRYDMGAINNPLGAVQGVGGDLLVEASNAYWNAHVKSYNWAQSKLAPGAAPMAKVEAHRLMEIDDLPPGCGEQQSAALEALHADPRFKEWEIRGVTHHSRWGEGREAIPFSGYHHKVYAKSPVTGQSYSVDMWNSREIRPWSSKDKDFTADDGKPIDLTSKANPSPAR